MRQSAPLEPLAFASDFSGATGMSTAVFGFSERDFLPGAVNPFCGNCPLCDGRTSHHYGCYEAERWDGQYIYYCPASLVFVSTLIYENAAPVTALVSGPVVMGEPEDLLGDFSGELREKIAGLPVRSPSEVGAVARVQAALSRSLSQGLPGGKLRDEGKQTTPLFEPAVKNDTLQREQTSPEELRGVHGSGFSSVTVSALTEPSGDYPIEVERQLVRMIRRGDRQGASELINRLLGALYLGSEGDFSKITQGAAELVTLFSRAAIEGGADADRIFGENRNFPAIMARFTVIDEVSAFLVSVFNRFVGYVFDFTRFKHADTLYKSARYIRANFGDKITLAKVADAVGISCSYLSAIFKDEMGQGFTEYVQAVRVEKSREMLRNPQLSIAEVAALAGFTDQSYFTKIFTRVCGMSPAQFRRGAGDS
ncbi:MAG: helix-turn-helix domain-containing protein [Oscillospiraceae bacterium]|jgi:AraC-like DNA-binding protein|nr:helix-turn-helix domain-containing protein [Oscillospiraceae bacterium]